MCFGLFSSLASVLFCSFQRIATTKKNRSTQTFIHTIMSFPSDSFAKDWAHSKGTSFQLEYNWNIEQFRKKFAGTDKRIYSPKFSEAGHDIQFFLFLQSSIGSQDKQKYIDVYLGCVPGKAVNEVPVTYDLAFLDSTGNVIQHFGEC